MSADLLERLAEANPVPPGMPALPFDEIIARVELDPPVVSGDRRSRGRRRRRAPEALVLAGGVLIVCAVAAVILTAGRKSVSSTNGAGPAGRGATTGGLEVFERPQTAKDRTLFATVRLAARRAKLSPGFANAWLGGVIPSTTRYVRTLPNGAEVFLAELTSGRDRALVHDPNAQPTVLPDGEVPVKLIIVQPDGRDITGFPGAGQPIDGEGAGMVNNRIAGIEARPGLGGCSGRTLFSLMPNGVARVRWQFPRQDRAGTVYPSVLSVTVAANENVAVATITDRASCDKPTVATFYGQDGHVLRRLGNPATLNQTLRPLQPPPGGVTGQPQRIRPFCVQNPTACAVTTPPTQPRVPGTIIARINLTAPRPSSRANGIASISTKKHAHYVRITGSGVPASRPHSAYAVWLYNSPTDSKLLGFINPGPRGGQLTTAGVLPSNAAHYHRLLIASQDSPKPKQPGLIVLAGPFHL